VFPQVRSLYPPLGVPNMRSELNPMVLKLKLWCYRFFENNRIPRSAIPPVVKPGGKDPFMITLLAKSDLGDFDSSVTGLPFGQG
jgi:hypothetical protein